jgi:pullulanase/glycogen debranching enzyme
VNSLKWNLVEKNLVTRNYLKGLLELRASHPAFRIESADKVKTNLSFIKSPDEVIAYSLNGKNLGDSWSSIVVVHNAGTRPYTVSLPSTSDWNVVVDGDRAGTDILRTITKTSVAEVPALTTIVLFTK